MEQISGSLNILVAVALIFLAVSLMLISLPLMSMVKQSERTLSALERLLGTVDKELGPTLKQVDTLLGSIGDVGSKVGDVKGGITKAADEAKKNSSVFGAGFMAGIRAYLEPKGNKEEKERIREARSLSEVGK